MSVHGIAESTTQFATEQQHRIYTKSETCKLYTRGDNDASMLRFINFTKVLLRCTRTRDMWEFSVLSAEFCCEPKAALKQIKSFNCVDFL